MPPKFTDDEPKKEFAEEGMSNAELAKQLRDVQNQLAVTRAGLPLSLIPEHAAGPGMEIAETWSAAEQAAAIAAEAPSPEPSK